MGNDHFREKMKKSSRGFSISHKLLLLAAVVALPFMVMLIYLLASMGNYSKVYDKIVKDITVANNYNLNFKEDMDESMYKLVVGYVTFDNISEDEKLKDPYMLINDLRSEFTRLAGVTSDGESRVWLESLLRNIDTLEKRVDDVVESTRSGGTYDDNIDNLENNIYVLTELIQDDIQYYIYYQTQSMEEVTDDLNEQISTFMVACVLVFAVLVVGVTIAAVFITSGIIRPLKELNSATEKLAKGDFAARAEVNSRDEIAVLAEGFNDMAGNMQAMIGKIKEDEQKIRKEETSLNRPYPWLSLFLIFSVRYSAKEKNLYPSGKRNSISGVILRSRKSGIMTYWNIPFRLIPRFITTRSSSLRFSLWLKMPFITGSSASARKDTSISAERREAATFYFLSATTGQAWKKTSLSSSAERSAGRARRRNGDSGLPM